MQNDSDSNKAVIFEGVGKTYALGDRALHDVSFAVKKGEFVCIIGASGCGKSTVLKIIAGLEAPTDGRALLPRKTAVVFQSGALFPWLTALDNAAIGLRAKGLARERARRAAAEYMNTLGLGDFFDKYPRDLSGGQRQRVGIARALAVQPSVLLLDEPFSALDAKMTHSLHEDLISLWKDRQLTVIMVSHLIEEAVALGQRVILMEEGTIKESYSIDITYPRHEQGAAVLQEVQKIRRSFFA